MDDIHSSWGIDCVGFGLSSENEYQISIDSSPLLIPSFSRRLQSDSKVKWLNILLRERSSEELVIHEEVKLL